MKNIDDQKAKADLLRPVCEESCPGTVGFWWCVSALDAGGQVSETVNLSTGEYTDLNTTSDTSWEEPEG